MPKKLILLLGPLLCLLIQIGPWDIINPTVDRVVGVALWMILWWITEVVSISVTALIPLTFFPLMGIMDIKTVSAFYGHPIIFLFFGGFILALALEKVNLHRRLALNIIKLTGTRPDRVILGFLIATAFLSMWISNTATTVVMLPIAYSVIQLLTDDEDGFTTRDRGFAVSILLGIAYSANVGGIATIIGTPPNIVLAGFMESEYGYSISFLRWMLIGVPFMLIMLVGIYLLLTRSIRAEGIASMDRAEELIDRELAQLGPVSTAERWIMGVFAIAITLWITKNLINQWLPDLGLTDTTISLVAAFSCFCIVHQRQFIFTWADTKELPWGIIILFGGGLALANGLSQAGLIDMIGTQVSSRATLPTVIIAALLISLMLFMTELMSNVALIAIIAPMAAGVAVGMDIEVLHLLIPLAMASSCAFMLPMATPPNAIVFASGHIQVREMVRVGIFLNLLSILLLVLFFELLIPLVM